MKSTGQLRNEAVDYRFTPGTPLRIYLKVCVGILDKAQIAFQNGDQVMAYILYYRYVDLCTNKLSKHPEYTSNSSPELSLYRQEYLQLIKLEVPAVFKIIEDLQLQIDMEYNKHQLSLAKNIAKPKCQNNKDQARIDTQVQLTSKLPSTFNEHNFNQTISFLGKNSSIVNTTGSTSIANKDDQEPIFHYPELPKLSFPTF